MKMTEIEQKTMIEPLLLTPREAAKALSICERTLYSMTKAGEIPVVRIGRAVRYSMDELKDWIKKNQKIPKKTIDIMSDIK